eukprot:g16588.t1
MKKAGGGGAAAAGKKAGKGKSKGEKKEEKEGGKKGKEAGKGKGKKGEEGEGEKEVKGEEYKKAGKGKGKKGEEGEREKEVEGEENKKARKGKGKNEEDDEEDNEEDDEEDDEEEKEEEEEEEVEDQSDNFTEVKPGYCRVYASKSSFVFTAVDTNAKPVKFQDGPIIKYADDAGQFKEAVVLQGKLQVELAAGKDVLAVRNIWQGDDKPEKKELQFLDIYKVNADQSKRLQDKNMTFDKVIKPLLLPYVGNVDHAKLTMLRKFRERALLWNLEQKRTAKVKHESLNEQAMQSKQVVVPSEYASATDGCRCTKDAH